MISFRRRYTVSGAGTLTVAGLMTWQAGTSGRTGETCVGGLLLEGGSAKTY